jgi:hypothetical protein
MIASPVREWIVRGAIMIVGTAAGSGSVRDRLATFRSINQGLANECFIEWRTDRAQREPIGNRPWAKRGSHLERIGRRAICARHAGSFAESRKTRFLDALETMKPEDAQQLELFGRLDRGGPDASVGRLASRLVFNSG